MKHIMYTLNRQGDSTLEYDPAVEEDVKKAKDEFALRTGAGGMAAFAGTSIEELEQTRTFDPTKPETVFVPQIQGGSC